MSTLDRRSTDSDLVPTTGRGSRLTELGPPVSPLCIAMLGRWLWDAGQVCTQSCHTVTLVVLEVSVCRDGAGPTLQLFMELVFSLLLREDDFAPVFL